MKRVSETHARAWANYRPSGNSRAVRSVEGGSGRRRGRDWSELSDAKHNRDGKSGDRCQDGWSRRNGRKEKETRGDGWPVVMMAGPHGAGMLRTGGIGAMMLRGARSRRMVRRHGAAVFGAAGRDVRGQRGGERGNAAQGQGDQAHHSAHTHNSRRARRGARFHKQDNIAGGGSALWKNNQGTREVGPPLQIA
jgi:hypothetical protein